MLPLLKAMLACSSYLRSHPAFTVRNVDAAARNDSGANPDIEVRKLVEPYERQQGRGRQAQKIESLGERGVPSLKRLGDAIHIAGRRHPENDEPEPLIPAWPVPKRQCQ